MAIDPGIYGQIKPVQVDSPINQLARALQLRSAVAQQEEQERKRQLLSRLGSMSEADIPTELIRAGLFSEGSALRNSFQQQQERSAVLDFYKKLAGESSPMVVPDWGSGLSEQERTLPPIPLSPQDVARRQVSSGVPSVAQGGLNMLNQREIEAARDARQQKQWEIDYGLRRDSLNEQRAQNLRSDVRARDLAGMTDARARELAEMARLDREAARLEREQQKRTSNVDREVTKFANKLQDEAVPEFDKALAVAENTISKYEGDIPGYGRLSGGVPTAVLPDEARKVRGDMAALRNIVLKARSGAAVTDQELRRLIEEVGSGFGMTADDLRNGVKRIRDRLEYVKANLAAGVGDEILDEYRTRGGIPITRGKGGGGASFENIPPGAIEMLRGNPALAPKFDEKYGQGAASRVLGK